MSESTAGSTYDTLVRNRSSLEPRFLVTPESYVEGMELIELESESNSGVVIDLGGLADTCPACAQSYDQLALDFDMSGIEALNCSNCGVVAA